MTSNKTVFVALMAFDEAMLDKPNTMLNRIEAIRAALATIKPTTAAMCETCFAAWPIDHAPAVCPVCNKGSA